MPLNIRSEIVNQLAQRLAARTQMNKTDAVRIALENELHRLDDQCPCGIAFVRFRSGY
jgi:antitoxin VapB